ncbi:conserved hypothetical protein [Flavobacterium sp. 9R]|uniref:hypothetical protein n=1 Tax=Flavobacterium sp. 9R TaxID=2653143 RepID=UPI0012F311E6|nr:hypothetical protein [Flavobacterium sp. 9R]VXB46648.1 conserved hypothetical protein [Flavobacterium sp. 9R]
MDRFKFLKSVCLVIITVSSFTSCSKEIEEWNDTINADGIDKDSRVSLKINDSNYQEHFEYTNNKKINTFTWMRLKNSDGTNRFSISGDIEYIPSSPTEISLQGIGRVDFDINGSIKQGQIYDVKTSFFQFDIIFGGLSSVEYRLQESTVGQLKITFFDGVTMSGEFSFDKIQYYRGDSKITGTFSKIEEYKL